MNIQRISEDEFADIGYEWRDLLAESEPISPMMTWEWMFSWWESYRELQSPCELYVLTIRDGDRLIGIAPFYVQWVKKFFILNRVVQFLGTGEPEADETCSEFLDIIVLPGMENSVVEVLIEYLLNDKDWNEIIFKDVLYSDESPVCLLENKLRQKSFFCEIKPAGRCPFIKLPDSWDEYYKGRGKRTKKLLRYERGRIEKQCDSKFIVNDKPENILDDLEHFKILHEQRWAMDGKQGCFASKTFNSFIDNVVKRLTVNNSIQFSNLLIDGNMAVSFCLLRFKNKLYFYNSAVDIDKYGKLSPGTVGLSYVIEDAIKNKYDEFHFFKGGKGSYKDKWTSDVLAVSDIVIRRKTFVHYMQQLMARIKKIKKGFTT